MRRLMLFVLALMLLTTVAAYAVEVSYGVAFPIYSERNSELQATAGPQAELFYCNRPIWNWSAAMDEFLKDVPTSLGIQMRVYPNVNSELQRVMGVYASISEVGRSGDIRDGLIYQLQRDLLGRWYLPLDVDQYPGARYIRFFAIIQDAKRSDRTFLVVFHWARKKDSTQYVERFEYTTSPWCGPKNPSDLTVASAMRKVGVGGSGLVYDQLFEAERQKQEAFDRQYNGRQQYAITQTTGPVSVSVRLSGIAATRIYVLLRSGGKVTEHPCNCPGEIVGTCESGSAEIAVLTERSYNLYKQGTYNVVWKMFPTWAGMPGLDATVTSAR